MILKQIFIYASWGRISPRFSGLLDCGGVEPVEKGGELGVAVASVEGAAYVPVGGVEDAQRLGRLIVVSTEVLLFHPLPKVYRCRLEGEKFFAHELLR